jgi:hypothetical protein
VDCPLSEEEREELDRRRAAELKGLNCLTLLNSKIIVRTDGSCRQGDDRQRNAMNWG